ncbi:uncharacterized protein LOC111604414 [Drosophila hydei]|uniref:Uncharacterized protein LOC111604414 n=1 Tax=Drosophila hydei TaxID=7224 RepID=A0A6J1MML3_DROHY|nr:uncharacterized protein LOC111604414 [Drosophila hydei]
MQFPLDILLPIAGAFIVLNRLPSCWARSITAPPSDSVTELASSDGLRLEAATVSMDHVQRRREVSCQTDFTDFNVLHMPCDVDLPNLSKYIETLPNQCICAYNTRFHSAEEYRTFKILQLESFFFGQYSERFKRFEMDPHQFDY